MLNMASVVTFDLEIDGATSGAGVGADDSVSAEGRVGEGTNSRNQSGLDYIADADGCSGHP